MNNGDRVCWVTASGVHGSGKIVAESVSSLEPVRHWFVAVDANPGEEHRVIYCAETWLVPESECKYV